MGGSSSSHFAMHMLRTCSTPEALSPQVQRACKCTPRRGASSPWAPGRAAEEGGCMSCAADHRQQCADAGSGQDDCGGRRPSGIISWHRRWACDMLCSPQRSCVNAAICLRAAACRLVRCSLLTSLHALHALQTCIALDAVKQLSIPCITCNALDAVKQLSTPCNTRHSSVRRLLWRLAS